jgi:hypothetical protein
MSHLDSTSFMLPMIRINSYFAISIYAMRRRSKLRSERREKIITAPAPAAINSGKRTEIMHGKTIFGNSRRMFDESERLGSLTRVRAKHEKKIYFDSFEKVKLFAQSQGCVRGMANEVQGVKSSENVDRSKPSANSLRFNEIIRKVKFNKSD